jgi:asparagine synthetase B (glutamine-hydrolysing)
MCGIFAYISKNNKDYDILNIEAKKSSHRGPDNTSGAKCKYKDYYIIIKN